MNQKVFAWVGVSTLFFAACAAIEKQQALHADRAFPGERKVASYCDRNPIPGVEDGVFLTKRSIVSDGQIGLLQEFRLKQEYEHAYLKNVLLEVSPLAGARAVRIDVMGNNQVIATYTTRGRQLNQQALVPVNRYVREFNNLRLSYDPRAVNVSEVTLMVSESVPGPVPVPPPPPRPDPYPGPRPDPRPDPYPGPIGGAKIVAYSDDHCRDVITEVTQRDSCGQLESIYGHQRLWSISIDGKCRDIQDRASFRGSCEWLQGLSRDLRPAPHPTIQLYKDDHCADPLLDLDTYTNCPAWHSVVGNSRIWSVRAEGRCYNIQDREFNPQSCEDMKHAGRATQFRQKQPDAIELFTDDHCAAPLTYVQRGDDCAGLGQLYGRERVWSIRFRGRCENIQDTNFPAACSAYTR